MDPDEGFAANRREKKWRAVKQAKLNFVSDQKSSKVKSDGVVQLLVQATSENPDWEWDPETKYRLQFSGLVLQNSHLQSLYAFVVRSKVRKKDVITGLWESSAERILFTETLGGGLKGHAVSSNHVEGNVVYQDLRCYEPLRIQSVVLAKPSYVKPLSLRHQVAAIGNLSSTKLEDKILLDNTDQQWLLLSERREAIKTRNRKIMAMAKVEQERRRKKGYVPGPKDPVGMNLRDCRVACREAFRKRGVSKGGLANFDTMDMILHKELKLNILQPRMYLILHQISQRFGYTNCKMDFHTFSMCASVISKKSEELAKPSYMTILDTFYHFDLDLGERMEEMEFLAALEAMGYRYEDKELRTLQAQFNKWTQDTNGQMTLDYFTTCFISMCDYDYEIEKRKVKTRVLLTTKEKKIRQQREKELRKVVDKEHDLIKKTVEEAVEQIWAIHVKKSEEPEEEASTAATDAAFAVRLDAALDVRAERERKKLEAEHKAKLRKEQKSLQAKLKAHIEKRKQLVEEMERRRLQDKRIRLEKLREEIGVDSINLSGMYISTIDEQLMKSKLGQALNNVIDLNLSHNNLQELPDAMLYNLFEVVKFDCSNNHLFRMNSISHMKDMRICNLQENHIREIPDEFGELVNLQKLNLSGNKIQVIPPCFGTLENLEVLHMFNNGLREISEDVFNHLDSLKILELQRNALEVLPDDFGEMPNLVSLDLSFNSLQFLPPSIDQCQSLKVLKLSNNQLRHLRPEVASLTSLQFLYLAANKLSELPLEIGSLVSLLHLDVSQNNLRYLPEKAGSLMGLAQLTYLSLAKNELQAVTGELGRLYSLHTLDLTLNNMTEIPDDLGGLGNLKKLLLPRNKLKRLPDELGAMMSLEEIDLSYNNFQIFPLVLTTIPSLQILNIKGNDINTPVPDDINALRNLSALDISINRIPLWPATLGECWKLRIIDASSNKIRHIPESFVHLRKLESLQMYFNKLEYIPLHLFEMTWLTSVNFLKNPSKDMQIVSKKQNWPTMIRIHRYYGFAVREWRKNSDSYNTGKMRIGDFLKNVEVRMGKKWSEEKYAPLVSAFFVQAHATRLSPPFDFMCRQTM